MRSLRFLLVLLLPVACLRSQGLDHLPHSPHEAIVRHSFYALSFAPAHLEAEWVAYRLTGAMTEGTAERSNQFRFDPVVPGGSARPGDYARSGYDKGHLCPAADMKWDAGAMEETFFMSNMTPQAPMFNRGVWKELEEQVREWAKEWGELYVVTGPVLRDGLPGIGTHERVSVPEYFYKIVLIANDTLRQVAAFLLPNAPSSEPLSSFAVPVDSVRMLTHIDFFPALPESVKQRLERRVDLAPWRFTPPGGTSGRRRR
jgi:endonuclease G, mitochondrial